MSQPTKPPVLTVRAISAVGVEVPMTHVLGTSRGRITKAPLLLIDVETDEGVTGRSYLWSYFPRAMLAIASILQEIEERTRGERVDPAALWARLAERFALIGVQGVVRMAMAGFDIACWDALATAAGQPLVRALGGEPRRVPAYNSCGLGLMGKDALADEAEKLLDRGFRAIKLRLGYATLDEDMAAVHAVKQRLPDGVALMVDYNQALSVDEALKRGRALDREDIAWLEEPIRHDDYAGAATLAKELAVPVQIGENFSLLAGMQTALDVECCDLVMPDLERIGGVSGWLSAAKLAAERGMKMSSHLYSEASAHLLAVTPTAHYLEYVDWADKVVQEPLRIVDGHAVIPERPGIGIVWNKAAVERYRV
ncbi:MAG: mandelate racemase [Xanthobacteraceae bacterium]|nr:mandelate racemase [Xanthobacteraceae bacterium]MBX9845385.1 mandelate racemase [Xanthobacteraceae bacterium]